MASAPYLDRLFRMALVTSIIRTSARTRYYFPVIISLRVSSQMRFSLQGIFLFCGCLTIACAPLVWFFLPDSPATAKFFKGNDRILAIERLRDNNMGVETKIWKWAQFWETFRDLKTYLWFAMLFLAACPSGGIGAFGTLIVQGFGFDSFQSILFNMGFGVLTVVSIFVGAWLTNKIRLRFPVIMYVLSHYSTMSHVRE